MRNSPVVKETSQEVATVVAALRSALARRHIHEFAVVDHAAGAREAGLRMPEETVIFFGSPKVGTAVMLADPTAGLELPLRVLVYDDGGTTKTVHHDPQYLADQYALDSVEDTVRGFANLLDEITDEAIGKPTAGH